MEVTNEQKTRDLAEKVMGCEWGPDACGRDCWLDSEGCIAMWNEFDPFTSRDDAHELLGKLTDEQWDRFARQLALILFPDGTWPMFAVESLFRAGLTATPAQISEAVWRVTCQN